MSEGVSEVSERVSAVEGASEASSPEQASERMTEWPSAFVWILHYSGPQCSVCLVICVVSQSVGHTFFCERIDSDVLFVLL